MRSRPQSLYRFRSNRDQCEREAHTLSRAISSTTFVFVNCDTAHYRVILADPRHDSRKEPRALTIPL
jgi:hypothetical protein